MLFVSQASRFEKKLFTLLHITQRIARIVWKKSPLYDDQARRNCLRKLSEPNDDGIPLGVIDFSSSLINCVYYFSTICHRRVSRDAVARTLESKLNGESSGDGRQREQSAVSGTAGRLRRADVPDQVGDTVDYGKVFAAGAG
uniref:(northern house mosquito) hypothetical protein n=1 Tax=Culex pipiens TaxID=7175 RepID=A0A8D8FED3_CULPI